MSAKGDKGRKVRRQQRTLAGTTFAAAWVAHMSGRKDDATRLLHVSARQARLGLRRGEEG